MREDDNGQARERWGGSNGGARGSNDGASAVALSICPHGGMPDMVGPNAQVWESMDKTEMMEGIGQAHSGRHLTMERPMPR